MARQKVTNSQLANSVSSISNTGTAGGTIYYINLGGMKMAWGRTNSLTPAANTEVAYSITLPSGFFTTIQSSTASIDSAVGSVVNNIIMGNNISTSTISIYIRNNTAGAGVGGTISYFVIGT